MRAFFSKEQIEALKKSASNTPPASETPPANPPAEEPKKKKWVMPVLIGSGVLVVGILVFVLLKKK
jgi:hypothetical protein